MKIYKTMTKEKCKQYLPFCADCGIDWRKCVGLEKCTKNRDATRYVESMPERIKEFVDSFLESGMEFIPTTSIAKDRGLKKYRQYDNKRYTKELEKLGYVKKKKYERISKGKYFYRYCVENDSLINKQTFDKFKKECKYKGDFNDEYIQIGISQSMPNELP